MSVGVLVYKEETFIVAMWYQVRGVWTGIRSCQGNDLYPGYGRGGI